MLFYVKGFCTYLPKGTAPYLINKRYVDEKAGLCHNYVFSKVEIQWLAICC